MERTNQEERETEVFLNVTVVNGGLGRCFFIYTYTLFVILFTFYLPRIFLLLQVFTVREICFGCRYKQYIFIVHLRKNICTQI